MTCRTIIAVGVLGLISAMANAGPNSARIAWSAFSCAVFAELSGNPTEKKKRLFELGYASTQRFVANVASSPEDESIRKDAPIGILMLMGGPSQEFIVGRIYESVTEQAFDEVVKTDSAGMPVHEPSEWLMDDELKKSRAEHLYGQRNCELIK